MHTFLLISAVFAIVPQAFAYVYSTQSLCKTAYATKSPASVKSTSYALTIPLTFICKSASTPTTTITPAPVSTTVTTTSTITTVVATAATTTIVTTTTSTSTVFTTSTQTVNGGTTTITTGTTTVPTSAGFTPIVSGFQYSPKKRSAPLALEGRPVKRAVSSSSSSKTACWLPVPSSNHTTFHPPIYPTAVTCGYLVEAITTTTKTVPATSTAKTTISPSTKTGTSTVFTTVTSVSTLPSSSTTITVTAPPATTTSTVTTTTTTNTTVVAPAATFYAACAPNNIVNSANGGNGIPFISYAAELTQTSDTTAYDCCVSCQQAGSCDGFAFLSSTPTCYYFGDNGVCTPDTEGTVVFESSDNYPPSDGYTIGDGPCGQVGNVGNAEESHFPDPPDPPFGF